MTNLIKVIIGAMIAVAVIAGIGGFFVLKGGESDSPAEQAGETSPSTTSEGEVVLEKITEPKKTIDTIKIGVILPLTGPAAFIGEEIQNSMALASEEINGPNGQKRVELFIEDSSGKPKEGVSAFNRLENTVKPDIYISATSSVSMALAPLAEQNQVILLAIVASAPKLTQQNEYTYRYFPTTQDHMALLFDMLRKNDINKAGIIYLNDDFGNSFNQLLKEGFKGGNRQVLSESFLPSEKDFRTQLTKLKSQGAEAILVIGNASHIVNIVNRLDEMQFEGMLIGQAGLSVPTTIKKLDDAVDGAFALAPIIYDEQFSPAQPFMTKYKNQYSRVASYFAANAYDALNIVAEATKDNSVIERKDMVNYLATLDSYEGVFGPLKIDKANREITFELFPVKIESGNVIYLQEN